MRGGGGGGGLKEGKKEDKINGGESEMERRKSEIKERESRPEG